MKNHCFITFSVAEPPEEYKAMIDVLKKRHQEGRIQWHSEEEIKKQYGK